MTFVDTGAWVALFVERDARHEAARAWINSNRDRLVTSDYIVDEVLTLITARYRRQTAIRAGHVLFGQGLARLLQLTDEDKELAWVVFRSHSDKGWSFTDCTSFALMQRLRISTAFAFDRHFSQMRGVGACRTELSAEDMLSEIRRRVFLAVRLNKMADTLQWLRK